MERQRQAGLGRSLEDVLDSLAPIESADSPPAHALFGLTPDDGAATNGTTKTKKKKKKKTADAKSADSKKKKKKKKKSEGEKSKGKKKQ
jgi:hypothetical protein